MAAVAAANESSTQLPVQDPSQLKVGEKGGGEGNPTSSGYGKTRSLLRVSQKYLLYVVILKFAIIM